MLLDMDNKAPVGSWRGKLVTGDGDPRVEIRKHFEGTIKKKAHEWDYKSNWTRPKIDAYGMLKQHVFAQGLIVVRPNTVTLSFNGTATMNSGDFDMLEIVVDEAREILRDWASEQEMTDHFEAQADLLRDYYNDSR